MIVGVDVQDCHPIPLRLHDRKSLKHQSPTQTSPLVLGSDRNHVDLPPSVTTFHPAETSQIRPVPGHEQLIGTKPRLTHPVLENLEGPPAILRMIGEGGVVDLEPRLFVVSRHEGCQVYPFGQVGVRSIPVKAAGQLPL